MKDRIKLILKDKKLTQAEFADKIGVGRPNITHLMTGRDKSSQVVASKTLLAFPEINPMWLLKGEGAMYKSNYVHSVEEETVSPSEPEDYSYPQEVRQPMEVQADLFEDLSNASAFSEPEPVSAPAPAPVQTPAPAPMSTSAPVQTPAPAPAQAPVPVSAPAPAPEQAPAPVSFIPSQNPVPQESVPAYAPTVPSGECYIPKRKERRLKKIVFFYNDRSFEEYYPSEDD